MLDLNTRHQLSDDVLRRFGAALRGVQLYAPDHPIVRRNLEAFIESLAALHTHVQQQDHCRDKKGESEGGFEWTRREL